MKTFLMKMLRIIVKGIYVLKRAIQFAVQWVGGIFRGKPRRQTMRADDMVNRKAVVGSRSMSPRKQKKVRLVSKQNTGATVAETTSKTRLNSKKKQLWKDKRVIAGGLAFIVVLTVVLVALIPGADEKAYAQDSTQALAALSDVQETQTQTSETTESSVMAAEQTEETMQTTTQNETVAQLPTSTPVPTPIPTTEPDDPELLPGIHDSRIVEIQEKLMSLGYMEYDEPTDYYGSETGFCLQLFQRKHSLQVDGLIGDETLSKLFSDDALPYTVKIGDEGYDVTLIQEELQDLNYLKRGTTGYFGTETEAAVKRFQHRNDLSEDGNVGEHTRDILFSEDAKAERVSSGGSSSGGSSGGSSSGPIAVGDPDDASADSLIEFAKTQLGKKYVRGGKGPDVFDCSGFVYYCLNKVGYKIKYMTSGSWAVSSLPRVEQMSDMKRGDIICFKGHVGIYMGDGKMIDASSSNGKIVTRSNIFNSSYWTRNFICARRVF